MRFANHDGRLVRVTRCDEDLIPVAGVDVAEASEGRFASDPQVALERWSELIEWARADGVGAGEIELTADRLGPPAPRPRQVLAIGLNYADHAAESRIEAPAEIPATFTKFQSSLAGPFDSIELPSDRVDWEVELVVVIGRSGHRVAAGDAWDHVAGLTIGQDLSERAVQLSGAAPQFSLGKSFPGFGPTGPALVTVDELRHASDLRLTTTLDGETMQDGRTAQLIFDVPTLIERLSRVVTLLAGDIIFTGTPAGVGMARTPQRFLAAGQTLVSEIEGLGQMRHSFRDGPA